MHESDRNRELKRQRVLLLAAADMNHARAAARALDVEANDVDLMRALETAIAVSYARAFTQSSLLRLDADTYEPLDPELAEIHRQLCKLRDKVYAHTDKDGGRSASVTVQSATGLGNLGGLPGKIGLIATEEWQPFPRAAIPSAIRLFEGQHARFQHEASLIAIELAGLTRSGRRQPGT
jgi:hypothetical protein